MRRTPVERSLCSLSLVLHWTHDGQLIPTVKTRTWRGEERWDRRVAPPRPLGVPPLPPPGVDPYLHYLSWAIQELTDRPT